MKIKLNYFIVLSVALFLPFFGVSAGTKTASSTPKIIMLDVPFVSQAPLKEWSNPRFQDACEEASVYMAIKWVKGEKINGDNNSLRRARNEILSLSQYQTAKYGNFHDTSAADTAERLIKGYYKHKRFTVKTDVTLDDIIDALKNNQAVILPTNGRLLKNPYFSGLGPINHMIVVKGYDPNKNVFIVNDPGTKKGENFKYSAEILNKSISDYPTGVHKNREDSKKIAIFVKK